MKDALNQKKHVPAPNMYKIPQIVSVVEKRFLSKPLYKEDRKTYFTELAHSIKYEKITARPTSYNPNPLHWRKGSAKIKGNLTVSDDRVTLPIEASMHGK